MLTSNNNSYKAITKRFWKILKMHLITFVKKEIQPLTIIMNPQLEENYKVQSLFGDYKTEPFMRRRAYKKSI